MTLANWFRLSAFPQLTLAGWIALSTVSGCRAPAGGASKWSPFRSTQPAPVDDAQSFAPHADPGSSAPPLDWLSTPGVTPSSPYAEPHPAPPASPDPGPALPEPTDGQRKGSAGAGKSRSSPNSVREKMNSVLHRNRDEGSTRNVPRTSLLDRFRHQPDESDPTTVVDAEPEDRQPVKLGAPPEIYQFRDEEEPSYSAGQPRREHASTEELPEPSSSGQRPDASQYFPIDTTRRAQRSASLDDAAGQPAPRPLDMTPAGIQPYQGAPLAEPARIPATDEQENLPPSPEVGKTQAPRLAIPHLALCNAVRKYEDISTLNPQNLRAGQDVVLYASLANYQSMPTVQGYRTLTLSSLEVRTKSGRLITRQPLGTATDMSRVPRRDYYVAHPIRIPDGLPAGEYVFSLSIYDLTSRQTSQSKIAVQVTEDHTRLGGKGGSAGSDTRPASFRR